MSDVINVKIVGDLAYVQGATDEAKTARDEAKKAATDAENFLNQMKALPADFEILDDGNSVGQNVDSINFKGAGVTASKLQDGVFEITIPGGGGTGSSDTAEQIRDKLESLSAGQRLDADHIDETGDRKFLTSDEKDKLAKSVTSDSVSPEDDHVAVWESNKIKAGPGIGTGASDLVQLDGTGKLPAIDGSQLINLPLVDYSVKDVKFEGNNIVFDFNDGSSAVLANAKLILKGDPGADGKDGINTGGYIDKGVIGQDQDAHLLDAGFYYVTEKFTNSPTLSGSYVGHLMVQDKIDDPNGRLLVYFTSEGLFYQQKFAGGWEPWEEAGQGVKAPLTAILDGEIYSLDQTGSRLVPTGVIARNGSIQTSSGSVMIGDHSIHSVGQNVGFKNQASEYNFVPPWQQIKESGNQGPLKIDFTSALTSTVRNADTSTDLTNPEWTIQQSDDEVLFRIEFANVVNPIRQVYLYGHELGEEVFKVYLGDLGAGPVTKALDYPVFIKRVSNMQISLKSDEGDVVVKGAASGIPAYTAHYRTYTETELGKTNITVSDDKGNSFPGISTLKMTGASLKLDPDDSSILDILGLGTHDAPGFDPSIYSSVIDHGYAADDANIKSQRTLDGWHIFKDLSTVGGRPKDSKGELIVYKKDLENDDPNKRHVYITAAGTDLQGKPAFWVLYKFGDKWSPWLKVNEGTDLSTINDDIAKLKQGDVATAQKLASLETQMGSIYAPSKTLFDQYVNALIDAKIAQAPQSDEALPSGLTDVYGYFGNTFLTDLSGDTVTTSQNRRFLVSRTTAQGSSVMRLFVAVPNDAGQAEKVESIKVDNGISARWQHRDSTISGKAYRTFYSSVGYYDKIHEVTLNFNQG